jgi:hypothetical protein
MHNLEGMLSALDPALRESVKIIGYFDALVSERVGVDALLRAAALLAGCPAGAVTPSESGGRRVDVGGLASSTQGDVDSGWASKKISGVNAVVWIERAGPAHVNDEMILERLGLAVGITYERTIRHRPRPAIEVLVDAFATREEKESMVRALGLSLTKTARVVASPASTGPISDAKQSVVLPTDIGLLRVALYRGQDLEGQAGIGLESSALELATSWRTAIIALKLTTPARPIVNAAELGVLLQLGSLDPDDAEVAALAKVNEISPWAIPTLDALAEGGSVRSASVILNRHPSTVHARLESLSTALGFDVRSPQGRLRTTIAVALLRMKTAAF